MLACQERVYLEDATVTVGDLFECQHKYQPKLRKNAFDTIRV